MPKECLTFPVRHGAESDRRQSDGDWRDELEAERAAKLGGAGALGENGQALVADLGEAAGDGDPLGASAGTAVNGNLTVAQRRHVRRMAGEDAGFALGSGDAGHV